MGDKYWAVVVAETEYILIGVCPGETKKDAIKNAKIDFKDEVDYWVGECGERLDAVSVKKYNAGCRRSEDYGAAMAG